MGDETVDHGGERRIRIMPGPRAAAAVAAARASGWTVVDGEAAIVVCDVADLPVAGETGAVAVIAVTTRSGSAGARDAFARGATHWVAADFGVDDLGAALDFADRFVRRSTAPPSAGRRAGEDVEVGASALHSWVRGQDTDLAVIVVRLSRFEFVNAAFGREAGDALIAAVETRIAAWAQTLARDHCVERDGAEFVIAIALRAGMPGDAMPALETMLAAPFAETGAAVSLGIRIGTAPLPRHADVASAMAAARRAIGPARSVDPEPRLDRLAADLHRALDRNEIQLRFQPQAVVATGAVVGVEALSRWHHPILGELGAESLFAAAERAGLGPALSDHIHRRAFEAAAAWPDALARLRLSINVTAADLTRAHFADALLDAIAAAGLARGRVTVEIVETELIDDLDGAAALLARLRGAGLRTAIDDFGTGYSSLAYLKALPIDYVKIDRSLTRDIAGSDRDRAVVRGVIAIARSLGLGTIAEGVEAEAERALLAAEGCDLYQGFLCAGALDGDALVRLLGTDHL